MTTEDPQHTRASRFLAGLPASICCEGGEFPCQAHNLSRTGVLLMGDVPVPAEKEVQLIIESPRRDLSLTLVGRIRWAEREEESRETRLAIEFLSLPEDDRTELEALIARVVEGGAPASLGNLPDGATKAQIEAALESVPLAHRISLAARGLPKERQVLLKDRHLQVIDALARNPSLLPHELLQIIRMPNLLPHTLQTIAKDKRWKGNEQVMVRVASHRNTPLGVAEEIVSGVPRATLEKVIRAPDLAPALRVKVLRRLERRG
jgi:hypothetical protein